jgi:hypothetical protein
MRTTVDIESGLLKRLRVAARQRGVTVKQYLAIVLERGLQEHSEKRGRIRIPVFSMGQPRYSVDLDKSLRIAAELEDEETARELTLRK